MQKKGKYTDFLIVYHSDYESQRYTGCHFCVCVAFFIIVIFTGSLNCCCSLLIREKNYGETTKGIRHVILLFLLVCDFFIKQTSFFCKPLYGLVYPAVKKNNLCMPV